jgi:hypothetical protein
MAAGVDPSAAGPVAGRAANDHYQTDSAYSRVFWCSGLPKIGMDAAFHSPMILESTYRRTMTMILEPVPSRKAEAQLNRRQLRDSGDQKIRDKFGKATTMRDVQGEDETERKLAELLAGHGYLRMVLLVAVSADDLDGLEEATGEIQTLANLSRLDLRILYAQQSAAFAATCLPLGLGVALMTRRAAKAARGDQAGTTNRREERIARRGRAPGRAGGEDRRAQSDWWPAASDRRAAGRPRRRASRGVKWSNREYVPMRLAPFQETTANIQGLYPFVAEAGIDAPGILVGRNLLSSGSFAYDTFELYRRGMLFNPNGLVQGTVGSGKSSFVKTTIRREAAFGIKSVVPCDPKGEYTRLARWMGYEPVFLGPGLRTGSTPDVPPRPAGLTDADWVREISNARIAARRVGERHPRTAVTLAERKAITIALQKLTASPPGGRRPAGHAVLPDLVAAMLELDDHDAYTAGFADARVPGRLPRRVPGA